MAWPRAGLHPAPRPIPKTGIRSWRSCAATTSAMSMVRTVLWRDVEPQYPGHNPPFLTGACNKNNSCRCRVDCRPWRTYCAMGEQAA